MEMVAAAATKDAKKNGGTPEWRVTVPEGASVTVEHERCLAARAWGWLVSCVVALGAKVSGSGKRLWKIGADDPRRAVHGLKVGLALSLVSVFYYTRPLYEGVGGNAMWAIMTVVVVFEYTVGESYTRSHVTSSNRNRMLLQLTYESAWVGFLMLIFMHARAGGCVYKGFNRAAATVSAGAIALGVHWVAVHAGGELEPFIRSGSVFLLGTYMLQHCTRVPYPKYAHALRIVYVRSP
jgi:uncharacterized membrane protein YccC